MKKTQKVLIGQHNSGKFVKVVAGCCGTQYPAYVLVEEPLGATHYVVPLPDAPVVPEEVRYYLGGGVYNGLLSAGSVTMVPYIMTTETTMEAVH